jgi:hypothetical protein
MHMFRVSGDMCERCVRYVCVPFILEPKPQRFGSLEPVERYNCGVERYNCGHVSGIQSARSLNVVLLLSFSSKKTGSFRRHTTVINTLVFLYCPLNEHPLSFVSGTEHFFSSRYSTYLIAQSFCVFFFYRPTGRPKRTSLPLDCHHNAINRNHFGSSARYRSRSNARSLSHFPSTPPPSFTRSHCTQGTARATTCSHAYLLRFGR